MHRFFDSRAGGGRLCGAFLLACLFLAPPPAAGSSFGPAIPGTWRNLGPEGGSMFDVAVGRRLFAATERGIYRPGDGGDHWRLLTRGLPNGGSRPQAVVLDPSAPQTAYAVFLDPSSQARRAYKSVNGGAIWRSISSGPLLGRRILTLVVDPRDSRTLYAGCQDGVVASHDAGATWLNRGNPSAFGAFKLLVHPVLRGTLYAGTPGAVSRSTDDGAHWTRLSPALSDVTVHGLAFSPATPRTLYAATSNGSFGGQIGGVFKSTDAGASWRHSSSGLRAASAHSLAIDPKSPSTLWLDTDAGLWKSGDRGETWARLQVEKSCAPFGPLSFDLDPEDPQTAYIVATDTSQYFICGSHDGGVTWSRLLTTIQSIIQIRIDPLHPSTLYAAGDGLWESPDRGATWLRIEGVPAAYRIHRLDVSSTAPSTVYAYGTTSQRVDLLRSTDGGAAWEILGNTDGSTQIQPLDLDPFDSQRLWSIGGGNLRRSNDGGLGWQVVATGPFEILALVQASEAVPDRLHVTTRAGAVYATDDGGSILSPLGAGPEYPGVAWFITDDPSDPGRLYVGTNGGPLLAFTRE